MAVVVITEAQNRPPTRFLIVEHTDIKPWSSRSAHPGGSELKHLIQISNQQLVVRIVSNFTELDSFEIGEG